MLCQIPCAICKKELENISEAHNQPSGGTEFVTHGHYGSTKFDPMNNTMLALNICDDCFDVLTESKVFGKYDHNTFKVY
jgi:hypothetical protein